MRGFRHINAYYRTHLQNQTIYGRVQWVVTHRVASRIISRGGLNGHDFCRCFNLLFLLENVRRRSALIVAVLLGGGGHSHVSAPTRNKMPTFTFVFTLFGMYVRTQRYIGFTGGRGAEPCLSHRNSWDSCPIAPPHSRAYVY